MATRLQIVFDCADPDRLARFWADAIHYQLDSPPAGYSSWEDWLRQHGIPEEHWNDASAIVDPDGVGPRIYFQRVPEPKVTKNRLHLDLNQGTREMSPDERHHRVDAEVERLTSLGAKGQYRQDEHGEYHVTMTDPEGNEFCVQ